MKFLMVGASGFIGRHLMAQLESDGLQAIGTQSESHLSNLIVFNLLEDRIQDCVGEKFLQSDHPVVCIIGAGISRIDLCLPDPHTSYLINVDKTIRLIDDLLGYGVKPVFLSSDGVFDGTLGYYTEKHPCSPLHEYGRQKVQVEEYLQAVAPDSLILRLGRVVGDDLTESHLFSEWYRLAKEHKQIDCIERHILSPTYVEDVAKGIILACKYGLTGIYHLTNSEFFPRDELATQFLQSLGLQAEVVCKPEQEFNLLQPRAAKTYFDSSKFVNATGMKFTSMRKVFKLLSQSPELAHQQ